MIIRELAEGDFDALWPILSDIIRSGDTYGYSMATTKEQAHSIWVDAPRKTFVAVDGQVILGTYYIKTNQQGPGSHICNCGYMVASTVRGRGIASVMCEHSQNVARELGYKAMQFNYVATSNVGAVKLWAKLGFETVGRLPKAFNHPTQGYVDALVMYKWFL